MAAKITDRPTDDMVRAHEASLPDPGYQRNETLAAQADDLSAEADRLNSSPDAPIVIDRQKVAEAIEAAKRELNGKSSDITGAQPGRVYCWVSVPERSKSLAPDIFVQMARRDGWVVVQGEDPEAREFRTKVDSTRKRLNQILMWTTKENHEKLAARLEAKVQMRTGPMVRQLSNSRDRRFYGLESMPTEAREKLIARARDEAASRAGLR